MVRAARAMATMVAGDEEGDGEIGKSDGNGDKSGRRATAKRAKVTSMRVMAMVTKVACIKEESEGDAKGNEGGG